MVRSASQAGRQWPGRREIIDSPWGPRFAAHSTLRVRNLIWGRVRLKLTDLNFIWPERLSTGNYEVGRAVESPGWQLVKNSSDRPVILLTLHFGPCYILQEWLRAQGIPDASVAGKGIYETLGYRRKFWRIRDQAMGLSHVPDLFETGNTWPMRDHLTAGRVLLVDVDSGRSRHTAEPSIDGFGLRMGTSLLALAYMTGAILIPCLITAEPVFGFAVHFGEPLEAPDRADKTAMNACCERIMKAYLPILTEHPEAIPDSLLNCLTAALA